MIEIKYNMADNDTWIESDETRKQTKSPLRQLNLSTCVTPGRAEVVRAVVVLPEGVGLALCAPSQPRLAFPSVCGCGWPRGLFVTSEITGGATGTTCTAGPGTSVVNGREVVFRTGVKPVRGLFRLLGVVAVLRSASTPSDVKPWTRAGSSPSSGAARFLPATAETGAGSGSSDVGSFAGSGVFAWKTDDIGRLSGVL